MRVERRIRRSRKGFTLVELMVAAALSIFIMVILTEAFGAGIDTFRKLKTIGDQQELLRSASLIIRRDLSAPHFGDKTDEANGPFLSDQRLDLQDPATTNPKWAPPAKGFFRLFQGSAIVPFNASTGANLSNPTIGYVSEGLDADGIPSAVARNHMMQFTIRLPGNRKHELFQTSLAALPARGPVVSPAVNSTTPPAVAFSDTSPQGFRMPGNLLTSWAEVAYWLEPQSGEFSAGNVEMPLYSLRRRQRLLIDQNGAGGFPPGHPLNMGNLLITDLPEEISWYKRPDNTVEPNTPETISVPQRRLQMKQTLPVTLNGVTSYGSNNIDLLRHDPMSSAASRGDDILLSNVISFEIKPTWAPYPGVVGPTAASDAGFDDLPPASTAGKEAGNNPMFNGWGARVFDTWTQAQGPETAPGPFTYDFSKWDPHGPTPGTDATSMPLRIRVKAVQIRLRIWDAKHQATRQVTIIQDL